ACNSWATETNEERFSRFDFLLGHAVSSPKTTRNCKSLVTAAFVVGGSLMVDALQFLWPAVEAVKPLFTRAAVVRWPAGVCEQLVAAGLLVPQDTAARIRCPECGQTHIAKPIGRKQTDG